jgi:hypothetical protein
MILCVMICFLAPIVLTGGPQTDTSSPVLRTADGFYTTGFWDSAITEYQRYLYFHPNSHNTEYCYRRISQCYRNTGDFNNAVALMRTAAMSAVNDSVRSERRLDTADIWVDKGNLAMGELEYSRLTTYSEYHSIQRRSGLKLATVLLDSYRWRDARERMSSLEDVAIDSRRAAIDSIFAYLESVSLKSPSTARKLSTIIPGSGQAYTGNWRKGLHSFALVGAWVGLIAYSIHEDRIALAVFSIPWLVRYYQGGRHQSAQLAIKYNRAQIRPPIEDIISEIRAIERQDSAVTGSTRTP